MPSRPASTPRTRPSDWLPSTGTLHRFEVAGPTGRRCVRVDSGVESGRAWSAPTTTPCWPRSSSMRPPARRRPRRWPAPWPGPASTGSPPTATCWCAPCATPSSWPATPTPASSSATGSTELAAPLVDGDAVGRHAVAAALAGQAGRRAGRRCPGHHPVGLPQQPVRAAADVLRRRRADAIERRLPVRSVRPAARPWSSSTATRSTSTGAPPTADGRPRSPSAV